MTKEEFNQLDESKKKYFAKEGEELRPITEMTKEELAMNCKEILEKLLMLRKPTDMPIITDWLYNNNVAESYASLPPRFHISAPPCSELGGNKHG